MSWTVEFSDSARHDLKKLDRQTRQTIVDWIGDRLAGCEDPRAFGKGLTADQSGKWRYRVGDYRILAEIHDQIVTIEVVRIGHRSKVYR